MEILRKVIQKVIQMSAIPPEYLYSDDDLMQAITRQDIPVTASQVVVWFENRKYNDSEPDQQVKEAIGDTYNADELYCQDYLNELTMINTGIMSESQRFYH